MAKELLVVGGGAAGFFCAVNAARLNPSLRVTIAEKTQKLLSKVKISGGGRCNITHACFDIREMCQHYPRGTHFVRKAFHHFFTTDTIQWFEERGLRLRTEADGRMFPVTDSSQSVIDCLIAEANRYHVNILMNTEVKHIGKEGERFAVSLEGNRVFHPDYVCIACGGFPKSSMFGWIRDTGHTIEEPVPSLFTFNLPQHPVTRLMGISVEHVVVRIPGTTLKEEGPLLVTHWGLSGPAVLRLSAWGARLLRGKNYDFSITVNWVPPESEPSLHEKFRQFRQEMGGKKVEQRNPFGLPSRLWEYLVTESGISPETRWGDLTTREANKLARLLTAGEFHVSGKTTFKEEFVTAGGVRLQEVDPNTMMSRLVPRLFFAGEILDVDGITGGYNFQHAWTSGFIAARSIAGLP